MMLMSSSCSSAVNDTLYFIIVFDVKITIHYDNIKLTGHYYLRAIATDSVGNTDLHPDSLLVYVDNTAPRVTITRPNEGDTIKTEPVRLQSGCNDGDLLGVQFQYRLDSYLSDPSWTTIDSTITYPPYEILWHIGQLMRDTVYQIRAVGSDSIGNMDNSAPYIKVRLDKIITGIRSLGDRIPTVFKLEQNYPNPFNPTTTIKYSIPKTSFVTIKVYDILGREVATLVNEEKKEGNYSVQLSAISHQRASGVYFYRMQALPSSGSGQIFVETKKLILLK